MRIWGLVAGTVVLRIQKIVHHYYDLGLNPRETWSSLFFNVPFVKFFGKLLSVTIEETDYTEVLDFLTRSLKDESPEVRRVAGNAHLKIGKLRAMGKLTFSSKDTGDEIRDIAKEATEKIKSIQKDEKM